MELNMKMDYELFGKCLLAFSIIAVVMVVGASTLVNQNQYLEIIENGCIEKYGTGNYSIVCSDSICACNYQELRETPYCPAIFCSFEEWFAVLIPSVFIGFLLFEAVNLYKKHKRILSQKK